MCFNTLNGVFLDQESRDILIQAYSHLDSFIVLVTEYFKSLISWQIEPIERVNPPIFGFAEYLATLAILTVIYTFGDAVYKFRARLTIIPLDILGFVALVVIGVTTLSIDYLVSSFGLWPESFPSPAFWQTLLGFAFFSLISSWIFVSFIKPPKFSRFTFKKYHSELYNRIVKGSDAELEMLASEIGRSAENIVFYAKKERGQNTDQNDIGIYANEILLMIANAKFCRKIIQCSPNTAIIFFSEVSVQEKYHIPIDTFAMNISKEAIMNKDSLLYHEDDGFHCGLIGYVKPFSGALYGDYKFLSSLGHQTPLDINYKVMRGWDADHLEAYCRATLTAFQSYLDHGSWGNIPAPLHRAFGVIQEACSNLYEVNEIPNPGNDDRLKQLDVVVDFIRDATEAVDRSKNIPKKIHRRLGEHRSPDDPLDLIALMMFEVVVHASSVTRSDFTGWNVQHNRVWSDFSWLASHSPKVGKQLIRKFTRLVYEEIKYIEKFPNYKSSRIIGFCLNVMGFNAKRKTGLDVQFFPLQRLLLKQVKKHFLKVRQKFPPEVTDAILVGTLSYDARGKRLIKTYIKGLNKKAPKEYFSLVSGKYSKSSS